METVLDEEQTAADFWNAAYTDLCDQLRHACKERDEARQLLRRLCDLGEVRGKVRDFYAERYPWLADKC